MRTFGDLQTEVLAHGFDSTMYAARVKAWLNEAYHRVSRHVRLPELEASATVETVAGEREVALPADVVDLISVTDSRGRSLFSIDSRDLDGSRSTGVPTAFALSGSKMILDPAPRGADTLAVRYWRDPGDMTSDADVPVVGRYGDALVSYALQRAYRAEDDFEAANFYLAEWQRALVELRADAQFRVGVPRQIPGTFMEGPVGLRFRRPT